MSSIELPLVLFTVICQAAVGIACMLALTDILSPSTINGAGFNRFRRIGMLIVVLIAAGVFFSVFHLGKPFESYKSLRHLGTSMLSLEIVALSVTGFLALIYAGLWWKSSANSSGGARRLVGIILAVCGIATLIVTSRIYMLPGRLPWDSWQTPAAFLLSALFIGSLALSLVSQGAVGCQADKDQNGCTSRLFAGLALVAVLMIVGVIAAFAQTHGLSVEQSTAVVMTLSSPWFYVRLVLGLIVPAAAALMVFSHRRVGCKMAALVVLCAVVGEMIGRAQFYHSVMGQLPS